jgi:glycosyltransferase involved in cell wall biosynthesis
MAAWAGCSVGAIPSIWPDPCPLVAIEAMAAGRPVVASATGGLTDLVLPDETGLLVPPGDAQALGGALRALLVDREQRDRLGTAARARAPLFTASAVIPRIERILDELGVTRARRSEEGP